MKYFTFYLTVFLMIFSASCTADSVQSKTQEKAAFSYVTVVNWNVETFFDAEKDGTEYSDFKNQSNWTREKYLARLDRLCSVIKEFDADIYVFEEIENENVIFDISNLLAGSSWSSKRKWNYSCFAKPEASAIGCGIISRHNISALNTHFLDIRTQKEDQPSSRYMLEADIEVDERVLKLFVNHWKSKSGGEAASDIWRDWQESVLAGRLIELEAEDKNQTVLICGDFNRDVCEFACNGNDITLRNAGFGKTQQVVLETPWLSDSGNFTTPTGSYYYQEAWERIDNIFTFGGAVLLDFSPETEGSWMNGGIPYAYQVYSGVGFSDHVPLFCSIRF